MTMPVRRCGGRIAGNHGRSFFHHIFICFLCLLTAHFITSVSDSGQTLAIPAHPLSGPDLQASPILLLLKRFQDDSGQLHDLLLLRRRLLPLPGIEAEVWQEMTMLFALFEQRYPCAVGQQGLCLCAE